MQYDVIIVGARLSEDAGVRVLLLEEGLDSPTVESMPRDVKHFYGKLSTLKGEYVWRCQAYVNEHQGLSEAVMRGRVWEGPARLTARCFFEGCRGTLTGGRRRGIRSGPLRRCCRISR
jgi:choline dehydrogenase-like flavoprotein